MVDFLCAENNEEVFGDVGCRAWTPSLPDPHDVSQSETLDAFTISTHFEMFFELYHLILNSRPFGVSEVPSFE